MDVGTKTAANDKLNDNNSFSTNSSEKESDDIGSEPNTPINGARRDSTQVWTPLLANGNGIATAINATDGTTYDEVSICNNNEWKDAEELKNLKHGITANHNQNSHQGNNNGSLLNGKNGLGLSEKYEEDDPLTGLYNQKSLKSSQLSADYNEENTAQGACGLFGCRPKWARSLASTHVFMVVFLIAYILQGMYMTYFVSIITTIEKLFQIKSKTTGFLLSASEMGQISTAMLLTYFAGRGHRPRWIACGMVLFSLAAFACALPHFIFGKELIQSTAFMNTKLTQLDSGTAEQLLEVSNLGFGMPNTDANLCVVDSPLFNNSHSNSGKLIFVYYKKKK